MPYSAIAVANYFIDKSKKLTNMRLQKMVFFCHARWLKEQGRPLITEPVVAWPHGPVIPVLYDALKHYGSGPVTSRIGLARNCEDSLFGGWDILIPVIPEDATQVRELLDWFYNSTKDTETWRLRAFSHAEGGSWQRTLRERGIDPDDEKSLDTIPRNLTILDDVIRECGR